MIKRIIQVIIGYIILTFGVTLLIKSNLGTGAWEVVYIGLNMNLGLTIGTWAFIITMFLIFFNAILAWEKPKFNSLVGSLATGLGIDFWTLFILKEVSVHTLFFQIICLIGGIYFLSLGIATYTRAKLFSGPIDGLMFATAKRLHIQIKHARAINEITALSVGFFLGGPIGIGTVLVAIILGNSIQFNRNIYDNFERKRKEKRI